MLLEIATILPHLFILFSLSTYYMLENILSIGNSVSRDQSSLIEMTLLSYAFIEHIVGYKNIKILVSH